MAEQITLRVAAAKQSDLDEVRQFFWELEELMNTMPTKDLGEWLEQNYGRISHHWDRILFGYETMYKNSCDPTLTYLDWRSEIKAANLELKPSE